MSIIAKRQDDLVEAFKLLWDEYADGGHFEGSGLTPEQREFLNKIFQELGGSELWRKPGRWRAD